MWTNDETLKDLEYSQRRSEKKLRHRERQKLARHKKWKKLYGPAVLLMLSGMFFTLVATLQTLGKIKKYL